MAPISDPSNIQLADIFVRRGDPAAHMVAWLALALFFASLLAIADGVRPRGRVRGGPPGSRA